MAKRKRTPAEQVENLINIQKNCLSDNYMVGLYNGLIVAHSCIIGKSSKYYFHNPLQCPIPKINRVRYKK